MKSHPSARGELLALDRSLMSLLDLRSELIAEANLSAAERASRTSDLAARLGGRTEPGHLEALFERLDAFCLERAAAMGGGR